MKYNLKIGEKKFEVEVGDIQAGLIQVFVNGTPYEVNMEDHHEAVPVALPPKPAAPASVPRAAPAPPKAAPPAPRPAASSGALTAPIPGLILAIKVAVGDAVTAGQTVATMEAMKMENNLISHVSGVVKEIRVQKGAEVSTGDIIMIIA
ncbi:MAG: biotin/lipoyl-binding protein [Desulfobacterales bacterium]|nr:MAG: biotin/lipoyl-binding protein [Desulfobacterales bacterium]